MDPAIVRRPDEKKDFPRKISGKKLTQLVDVLAEEEFAVLPSDKKIFNVTEEILGVYRPIEHIDNPKNNSVGAPDPRTIDKDFQPRATDDYFSVDPIRSMKKYISYSADFMGTEINKAIAAGPCDDGYRHFGAALHVLEDYFAHSNFVELSLKKIGYAKVLAWTSEASGKFPLPVVTGMFDSDDVIASTAGLIADTLFKVQWEFEESKPGKRTKADRIMLILLSEHSDPRLLVSYEEYLFIRDKMASIPGHIYVEKALHYSLGMVANAYNWVFSSLIHLVGNGVDDQQVLRMGDPNTNGSTNPTHSQLAKDHDNHPFHVLAALLAKEAVARVGSSMASRWWNKDATANPASVAASFITHPFDSQWQDTIVKNWALSHPEKIKRGESSTEWEALNKAHKKEIIDGIAAANHKNKVLWSYIEKNYENIFGKNHR